MEPINTNNPYKKQEGNLGNGQEGNPGSGREGNLGNGQEGNPVNGQGGNLGNGREEQGQKLEGQPTLQLEDDPARKAEDESQAPMGPRPRGFQPRPTVTFNAPDEPGATAPQPHGAYQAAPQAPQGAYQPQQPAPQRKYTPQPTVRPEYQAEYPNTPRTTPQSEPQSTRPISPRPRPTVTYPASNHETQPLHHGNETAPLRGNAGYAGQGGYGPNNGYRNGGYTGNGAGGNNSYGNGGYSGNGAAGHNGHGNNGGYPPAPKPFNYDPEESETKPKSKLPMIIAASVVALLLIGGLVWFFAVKSDSPAPDEAAEPMEMPVDLAPMPTADTATVPAEEAPVADASAGTEGTTLFNRPLSYSGNVGGQSATLSLVLFQNGRIEGNLSYKSNRSLPLYGSYTWTDNGHKMNVRLTVDTGNGSSESWIGYSSVIKDNLSHSLTFPNIATSDGESKRATFSLQ